MAGDLRPMRLAGIDIGTNTVLLLVAETDRRGEVVPLAEAQETPRLGKEVDASGRIRAAAFPVLAGIIRRYVGIAQSLGASGITACATSALRSASNREELIGYIREATGVSIEVIDGTTEAELTFRGALSGRPAAADAPGTLPAGTAVIDIGGGSTELCHGRTGGSGKPTSVSIEIGSVRLTERCFLHTPPLPEEVTLAGKTILAAFDGITDPGFARYELVAVAGTAVTLAGIHLGLADFDRERIEGCRISTPALRAMTARLLGMDAGTIRSLSTLTAGREDILGAGALILSSFAERFGSEEIVVSTRGLRYGIVLREMEGMPGRAGS